MDISDSSHSKKLASLNLPCFLPDPFLLFSILYPEFKINKKGTLFHSNYSNNTLNEIKQICWLCIATISTTPQTEIHKQKTKFAPRIFDSHYELHYSTKHSLKHFELFFYSCLPFWLNVHIFCFPFQSCYLLYCSPCLVFPIF